MGESQTSALVSVYEAVPYEGTYIEAVMRRGLLGVCAEPFDPLNFAASLSSYTSGGGVEVWGFYEEELGVLRYLHMHASVGGVLSFE